MTREEAKSCISTIEMLQRLAYNIHGVMDVIDSENCKKIIKALEQEPSGDLISRKAVMDALCDGCELFKNGEQTCFSKCEEYHFLATLPPVNPQEPKTGHCRDCKYFEYDSVAKVDGIPLIVAHEICSRWGDGCKTKEDGYCFLFEPKEGHWIAIDEEPHEDYECDKCGYTISTYTANIEPHTEYKYCPNCGAKMVEAKGEE